MDQLKWEPTLGKATRAFTPAPAKPCTQRVGVLDSSGTPRPTLQRLFVDDSVYADVYKEDRACIEQTITAGIEAIIILLGYSDLSKQQDPVSFNKMVQTMVSHFNKVLGCVIDTRQLDVGVPLSYITNTIAALRPFHTKQKEFAVKEFEILTGMLIHISGTTPWLKFMLSHVYAPVAAEVGDNTSHLKHTNKQFRQLLKEARTTLPASNVSTFAQAKAA